MHRYIPAHCLPLFGTCLTLAIGLPHACLSQSDTCLRSSYTTAHDFALHTGQPASCIIHPSYGVHASNLLDLIEDILLNYNSLMQNLDLNLYHDMHCSVLGVLRLGNVCRLIQKKGLLMDFSVRKAGGKFHFDSAMTTFGAPKIKPYEGQFSPTFFTHTSKQNRADSCSDTGSLCFLFSSLQMSSAVGSLFAGQLSMCCGQDGKIPL